jgi:hypothetical protein
VGYGEYESRGVVLSSVGFDSSPIKEQNSKPSLPFDGSMGLLFWLKYYFKVFLK